MHRNHAYVGTYTSGDGEGLYTYEIAVSDDNLDLHQRAVTPLEDNPSFLAVHPTGEYLYAVHEVPDGGVTAVRRTSDGALNRLNREPSGASGPCHCNVHPSGKYLFVTHYTGAAVSILPIRDDGRIAPPSDIVHHNGSSVHPERQTQSHPHSITSSPNGRFLYVPDLGTDEIIVYELDNGTLDRIDTVSTRAGAGPRHIAFHPSEKFAFVINELDSTLTSFEWTATTGTLTHSTTISTLPADYDGDNSPADVHVHPSGQWVYGSNRGHDSIAVFAVGQDGGALESVGYTGTGGEWPRNFALDAAGQVVFAENQNSDSIVAFRIDSDTGTLEPTGRILDIPSPVCMVCLPAYDD